MQRLAAQWRERHLDIREILSTSPALSRAKGIGYQQEELEAALSSIDALFAADPLPLRLDRLRLLCANYLESSCKPTKRGSDERLKDPFFVSCSELLEASVSIEQRFVIRSLLDATVYAKSQLQQIKQRGHHMSFDDQLTRLYEALQRPQGLALADNLRKAFPVAMIDEFQDTDPRQWLIFDRVFGAASKEPALFLIGDPKQAIYGFRGGDVDTYLAAVATAESTAAGVEVLASQCGIIENLMFPAVCGAGTPQTIVHEIPRGSLAAAQAAGFASTDSLTQWRLDRCPVYLHAIEVAQETTSCVESRNRVVLIQSGGDPERWVLLDQAGACADASYRQVLFGGQDGDEVLCSNAESIAGPQRDCAAKGHAAMFDTILANLDDEDLGLGAAYNIAQVYPAN